MADKTVTANKITLTLLVAAILLPSLIFVALQFGFGYRAERQSLETATLAKADAIMAELDGNMQRTRASALALASAATVKRDDWAGAYVRAQELRALNYDWKSVRLIDTQSGQEIFDLRRPFGERKPFRVDPAIVKRLATAPLAFESITRSGEGCPCIAVDAPVRRNGAIRYVMRIILDPAIFQKELIARAPAEGTSAIVDGSGRFIARTQNFADRVGKPATHFVLDAIRGGQRGIYQGVTFEGLANYTAFSTSRITGWSTHVAVPKARFDTPLWWSNFASTVALVISIALAVGLVWTLMRVMVAQRKADERVQQALRLEAVGKMTGGIAHDFNNMLAIVIGSLDLARRRRASGRDDVDRYIDNAMDGANRAAELTRRLLAFSRRQKLEPVVTNVNHLLKSMAPLLSRTLDETVRLRFDFEDLVWCVLIDRGQFENAIVNLAANARDAMPTGGELIIATANVNLSSSQAARVDLSAGDYVRIRIIDNGEGMSAETIRRAFEPFFTTKEVGRGTGLGLSQIYGFIDQSAGRVRIQSQLGVGTTVEMLVPRSERLAAENEEVPELRPMVPTGSPEEIILVAEDEEMVRLTNVEALRELGYFVRHASNGAEALDILATQPGVKLLFTDMVMPGMTGRELADAARRAHPDLKVLFATGYDREEAALGEVGGVRVELLRKPFAIEHLAVRIRTLLDA
ncbi:ATP-binding protein [Sphingomonas immobilis]|uniref:histidine kinase n=1 Tax=Sphingomonas immobilis TaxID=3063997 RepID=A0ABT8ZX31_9SPHN|nr:ATP-binding protein [Sphingomonas sp. CA1-15]MDO7841772.1 response regulator [Sphingomonas sp. CA1-15]